MSTSISGSSGAQYTPIEKTSPTTQVNKPQENNQEQADTCNVPQLNKKEDLPYPLLTGIEAQLDESFKKFKGDLKEAKEKTSIVFNQDSGSDKGITSSQNSDI